MKRLEKRRGRFGMQRRTALHSRRVSLVVGGIPSFATSPANVFSLYLGRGKQRGQPQSVKMFKKINSDPTQVEYLKALTKLDQCRCKRIRELPKI